MCERIEISAVSLRVSPTFLSSSAQRVRKEEMRDV
jgi:hypothetical protein